MPESSSNAKNKNVAVYIKFPGIKGGVTAKGFKDFVEAHKFRIGVNRSDLAMNTGNSTNRDSGRPNIDEITIIKTDGPESTYLLERALNGKVFSSDVEIHLVRTGSKQTEATSVYTLKNVIISRFESDFGEGIENNDPSLEKVGLNFTQMKLKATPRGKDGTAKTQSVVSYDLETASA